MEAQELKELIIDQYDYDRENGEILRRGGSPDIPKRALEITRTDAYGTIYATIRGVRYSVSNLIWLLERGELPTERVRHIDGIKTNNQIDNLEFLGDARRRREKLQGVTRGKALDQKIKKAGEQLTEATDRYVALIKEQEARP
jgi:hypothetical protein